MNRSILKTRNQLERITCKINQLKNKYTSENFFDADSPVKCPTNQRKSVNSGVISDRKNQYSSCGFEEDSYGKQFKAFRKEIYHYIDKCLLVSQSKPGQNSSKQSEQDVKKRLDQIESELNRNSQYLQRLADKIVRVEEQTMEKVEKIENSCSKDTEGPLAELTEKFEIILEKIKDAECYNDRLNEVEDKIMELSIKPNEFSLEAKLMEKVNSLDGEISKLSQKLEKGSNSEKQKEQIETKIITQIENQLNEQIQKIKETVFSVTSCIESRVRKVQSFYENKNQNQPQNNTDLLEVIDQKLQQFEKDINQAIKQLCQDIQTRIEQVQQSFKQSSPSLPVIKQTNSTVDFLREQSTLKTQIYQEMGSQLNKISSLLERTVEQLQIKMQKLEGNFSYIYERLSNIEYDNANFKDKLSTFMPNSPKKVAENKNTLLEQLSKLSSGASFLTH